MQLEKLIQEFVKRVVTALGLHLESVVLYGSAAGQEFDSGHSDVNILLLTRDLDLSTLRLAAPVLDWWRNQRQPQALLFTLDEFRRSTDAFPIEIHDIRTNHRILHGTDPFPSLAIDSSQHRVQLEYELRTKLLRLRQKAIPVLQDRAALLKLMADSVSTFLVLLRHAMLLKGVTVPSARRELLSAANDASLIKPVCFAQLIDLREGKISPKTVDSVQLFEDYLKQIETLVASVDAL
ncbi:hypothetical protein [Bryobacter aggregatus]|uniref:hypothetical protein n=1 Tax=Bryobacter aggregatus TaxID=360054 RepID=UPI0004E1D1F4|nr:hypothetical protein [Bryobacter aggregatus]